jgi:hypothetical protein
MSVQMLGIEKMETSYRLKWSTLSSCRSCACALHHPISLSRVVPADVYSFERTPLVSSIDR